MSIKYLEGFHVSELRLSTGPWLAYMKPTTKPLSILVGFVRQHPIVIKSLGAFVLLGLVFLSFLNASNTPTVYMSFPAMEIVEVRDARGNELPKVKPAGTYNVVWTEGEKAEVEQ